MHGLFPGHQAGASLKRGGPGGSGAVPVALFPGHQAGASLKHVHPCIVHCEAVDSSPVTKPGPH